MPRSAALPDPVAEGLILDDDRPPFCQRSPGYWRNHREAWPVEMLRLGCIDYDADGLLALLRSGGSDASTQLARHLVATKLNLAAGSDPSIQPVVDAADLFLAAWPPGSDPRGADRKEADRIKDLLDEYNNADCGDDSDGG